MRVDELRSACERLLAQAGAVRAAFPDEVAMREVNVAPLPDGDGWAELRAALLYLRQEAVLVRDGEADGVWVLDDEMTNVERELARLSD